MISDTTTSARYIVTNGVLGYSIPFRIYTDADVAVFWSADARADTKLTLGTHYTATILSEGGTVNLLPGVVPVGAILAVVSNIPATQEADFSSTSTVNTEALERQLDRQVQMVQQLGDTVARAVILPATSSETPQDVVQAVYAARDEAQSAGSAAHASETAADQSAADAAASANTAAQTVQTATAEAVSAATGQADAAEASAAAAAQSAIDAAAAVPENLVQRVTDVEAAASTAQTTADTAKAVTDKVTPTPTANAVPQAGSNKKLDIGWIPGLFVGKIDLLPFPPADLATYCLGWYCGNGDLYPLTSAVGIELNALSSSFKAAWGIVVTGSNISVPNLFYSDRRGFLLRAVNGSTRTVGSVQLDAMQQHTHGYYQYASNANTYLGSGQLYVPLNGSWASTDYGTGRWADETRSLNVGMTPAIFLGV